MSMFQKGHFKKYEKKYLELSVCCCIFASTNKNNRHYEHHHFILLLFHLLHHLHYGIGDIHPDKHGSLEKWGKGRLGMDQEEVKDACTCNDFKINRCA